MNIATKATAALLLVFIGGMAMPTAFQPVCAAEEVPAATPANPGDSLPQISDATFRAEVLKSKVPVFVDFSAPWCAPCKLMLPVLKDLSKEFAGKVKFVSVDVDQSTHTATRYNVNGLPSFFIFKGGKGNLVSIGLTKADDLKKAIEDSLR